MKAVLDLYISKRWHASCPLLVAVRVAFAK